MTNKDENRALKKMIALQAPSGIQGPWLAQPAADQRWHSAAYARSLREVCDFYCPDAQSFRSFDPWHKNGTSLRLEFSGKDGLMWNVTLDAPPKDFVAFIERWLPQCPDQELMAEAVEKLAVQVPDILPLA